MLKPILTLLLLGISLPCNSQFHSQTDSLLLDLQESETLPKRHKTDKKDLELKLQAQSIEILTRETDIQEGTINPSNVMTESLSLLKDSLSFYQKKGIKHKSIDVLKNIAIIHFHQGKLDSAEIELETALEYYESVDNDSLPPVYNLLSAIATSKGDLKRGLHYGLEAVKSMENDPDSTNSGYYYARLGHVYREMNENEQSIYWYRKSLDYFIRHYPFTPPNPLFNEANNEWHDPLYRIAWHMVRGLIKQKKEIEALTLMESIAKKYPTKILVNKANIAGALAECYEANKQFDKAETHYLELIWFKEKGKAKPITMSDTYYTVGKFYVNQNRFNDAEKYISKIFSNLENAYFPRIKDAHLMQFKIDSANGNYLTAIDHFQKYKFLSDSLLNETKVREIEELRIQFETEKKDQELKLRAQSIDLLTTETELQQKKISQAKLLRNGGIAGFVLLLIILGLLYNQNRLRRKSNEEINAKNSNLEDLLDEKKWLVKEIHHRVKNNLQTIVSLLESQSHHLEDEALSAIQESQSRIYAMSLIHQKLYREDNLAAINMGVYLPDLVHYLRDSFNVKSRIQFELAIESLELDVSQAIPLGIILNEAVTNSIKYAFPDHSANNVITVTLEKDSGGLIKLIISDNGTGLPEGFDVNNITSLGLKLIKGLTGDLNGQFSIKSKKGNGTVINISFEQVSMLQEVESSLQSTTIIQNA